MTASVYINADRTRVVAAGSPEAAFKVHVSQLPKLGIASAAVVKTVELEDGTRFVARGDADFEPVAAAAQAEPEAKEVPKPADKARRRPATK